MGGCIIICLQHSITVLNNRVFTSYETLAWGKAAAGPGRGCREESTWVFVNSGWLAHRAAVLSCLYYLRLEVEKLDLRVVPAFFFFFSFSTPPSVHLTMLKPIWSRLDGRESWRAEECAEKGSARYFSIHISTVAFLVYFNLHQRNPVSCLKSESLNCSLRSDHRCLVHVSYMSVSM